MLLPKENFAHWGMKGKNVSKALGFPPQTVSLSVSLSLSFSLHFMSISFCPGKPPAEMFFMHQRDCCLPPPQSANEGNLWIVIDLEMKKGKKLAQNHFQKTHDWIVNGKWNELWEEDNCRTKKKTLTRCLFFFLHFHMKNPLNRINKSMKKEVSKFLLIEGQSVSLYRGSLQRYS